MTTRQAIRKAVVDLIPSDFKTVFASYEPAIEPEDLPAACVYFDEGDGELASYGGGSMWSSELLIDIYSAKTAGTIDESLDLLGDQVADIIQQNPNLGGVVSLIKPSGFSYTRDEDRPIGLLSLNYSTQWES